MVAAVAKDEPQIEPKPAQAPTACHRNAALSVPQKGGGRVEQCLAHPATRRKLPHQQEKRDDRQRIVRIGVPGEHLHLRQDRRPFPEHEIGADDPGAEHGGADRHAQEDQKDEDGEGPEADSTLLINGLQAMRQWHDDRECHGCRHK